MRTICAKSVSLPTRSARMTKLPVPLTVPPVTRLPLVFSTGIGSPVIIDSSTEVAAFEHDAVHGNFLAGANAQTVADLHALEGDVGFAYRRRATAARSWARALTTL